MIDFHMRKNLNPNYIQGLKNLIDVLPHNIKMIEIGCYAGESTELFLQSKKIIEMVCIDPYVDDFDPKDNHARKYLMTDVKSVFNTRILQKYKEVTLYEKTSSKVLPFLDKSFDFVYIDGNHQFEPTKIDIALALNVLKPGSIIAGHDYNDAWRNVKEAVNSYFIKPDKVFEDDSWLVQL
jgi:predicted O-methyltransferase YrrM